MGPDVRPGVAVEEHDLQRQLVGGEVRLRLPLALRADHPVRLREVGLFPRRGDERWKARVVGKVTRHVQADEPAVRGAVRLDLTGRPECLSHAITSGSSSGYRGGYSASGGTRSRGISISSKIRPSVASVSR